MISFKDFFSFKNNRFFWINIIAMIVVIIIFAFGTFEALNIYTHHGEAVNVPNVKQLLVGEADVLLKNRDLNAVVVDSSYVRGVPAGIILEQNPEAGSKVKKGRTIYLTINSDKVPLVNVPDVMDNSSLRQAEAKLKGLGFKLTEPKYIAGERDWVYGLIYNGRELFAGEKVPREAVLTIIAGNGSNVVPTDSTDNDSIMSETDEESEDSSWF